MSIGDPINYGKRRTDVWIRRFNAPAGAKALDGDPLRDAVFETNLLKSWWHLRPEKKFGILALAEQVSDVFSVGAGSTGVAVEVPYPHWALVAGFLPSRNTEDIEDDLRRDLDEQWRPYVDPIVGPRISIYRDLERVDGGLALFVGRGVFLPERDENPIGSVQVKLADGSGNPVEPRLPDGRPAGIYRGQSYLAFAEHAAHAPATCSLLEDPKHLYVLQLERQSGWRADKASGDVCLTTIPRAPLEGSDARPDPRPVNPPPDGYDAAFDIWRDGACRLKVYVIRDRRRSILRRERPPSVQETLEVIGILAPDLPSFGRQIHRWWIDLDDRNLLVASASTTVAKSIIFAERSVETYERASNRFRAGSEPVFHLEQREVGGRDRWVAVRVERLPLGVLLPPMTPQAIGYDNKSSADIYQLDWLDFAGAVEPVFGQTIRLAEAAAGAADPSTRQMPSVEEVARMTPGKEFFLGPLLVRVGKRP